jgi:hypothetical protein
VAVAALQISPDKSIPQAKAWPHEPAEQIVPRPMQRTQIADQAATPTPMATDLKQHLQNTSLPSGTASGLSPSQQYEAFMYFKNALPLFKQAVLNYKRFSGAPSAYATSTTKEAALAIQQFLAIYDTHAPYLSGYASNNDLTSKYAPYIDLGRQIIAKK